MKKNVIKAFLLLVILMSLASCNIVRQTGNTEVAVAINKITGNGEVIPKAQATVRPFFLYAWYPFPTEMQTLPMEILFKTVDGNDIKQLLTVTWFFNPTMAVDVVEKTALNIKELEQIFLLVVARSKGRDIIGDAETKQYYNTSYRMAKQPIVKANLQALLGEYGVLIDSVSFREYDFVDDAYKAKIAERKKYEQLTEKTLKDIEAQLAHYDAERKKIDGENNKQIANADGIFERAKKIADADFYSSEREAETIKIEGDNFYEEMKAKSASLTGAGGKNLVKMEAAKHLKDVKKIFVSEKGGGGGIKLETVNMNKLIETMGVNSLANTDDQEAADKKLDNTQK